LIMGFGPFLQDFISTTFTASPRQSHKPLTSKILPDIV